VPGPDDRRLVVGDLATEGEEASVQGCELLLGLEQLRLLSCEGDLSCRERGGCAVLRRRQGSQLLEQLGPSRPQRVGRGGGRPAGGNVGDADAEESSAADHDRYKLASTPQ